MKEKKGFTVIELLVVLTVVGILVVVLNNQFDIIGYLTRSREAKLEFQIKEIRQALARYYMNHETYPGNLDQAGVNFAIPEGLNSQTNASGNPYVYPPPNESVIDALVKDKELKSAARGRKMDGSKTLSEVKELVFVAKRQLTAGECGNFNLSVPLGTLLDRPKLCWWVGMPKCRQVLSQAGQEGYYGACEAGGAIVGIVPLSDIKANDSGWWGSLCADFPINQGGMKWGIYKCE